MSEQLDQALSRKYDAGFVSDIESETFPPGLDEDVIRRISAMKEEPEWMLEWRLRAYNNWLDMEEPDWAHVHYPKIDFKAISYYSAPKSMA
ncbi:MAG: Fe-S cluster assembly protein SufB, partial [Paraglaciecola sp.]